MGVWIEITGLEVTAVNGSVTPYVGNFYIRIEGVYKKAIEMINEENNNTLFTMFKDRLENIVSNTSNIGWGFHDNLTEIYYEIQWLDSEDGDEM